MSRNKNFEDDDMYYNPDGLVVFTADYLLKRGYCCGNGCRHCPYDYKNVPEPRRTVLLQQREQENKNDERKTGSAE